MVEMVTIFGSVALAAYDKCAIGETCWLRRGDDSLRNFQYDYVKAEMMQDGGLVEILELQHEGEMVSAFQFKKLK